MPWVYYDILPYDAYNIRCECGEKADSRECTPREIKAYNCRPESKVACCARAFVCWSCGKRTAMRADPPEKAD